MAIRVVFCSSQKVTRIVTDSTQLKTYFQMTVSTAKKQEIARLLGNGLTAKKIAIAVGVGLSTVKRIKRQLKETDEKSPLADSYQDGKAECIAELKEKGDRVRALMWERIEMAFERLEKFDHSVDWEKTTPRDLIAAEESAVKLAAQYVQLSDALYALSE